MPPNGEAWRVNAAIRTVTLHGGDAPALLSMRRAEQDGEAAQLASGDDPGVLKVDFQRADAGAPVSAISGAGTVAFPGLETAPLAIAPGDFLVVEGAHPLELRRMSIGDALRIELRGTVQKLAVGTSGALRSQMPTVLQYIYWNKWLQMAFGAALTIGAAVTSLLYRFGLLSKSGD
jgi:hypothetical protein